MNIRMLIPLGLLVLALTGCSSNSSAPATSAPPPASSSDEVQTERAKLSAEDRALVDAQEWCVVSTDERLGSMGPPLKLEIKGQPVFVCCKSCKRKAEADPDKTLAKVEELKAKAKSERDGRK
ncbi:MAG: hypothetical protein KF873_12990 [Gemmataceae bacterium]|nr:hypothetical protein [Planctomycetia bacterium]MBX3399651.1 hypothetical protein [Gemmataceae bacterium]